MIKCSDEKIPFIKKVQGMISLMETIKEAVEKERLFDYSPRSKKCVTTLNGTE